MSELPYGLRTYREQLRDAVARDLARRPDRRRLLGFSAAATAALVVAGLVVGLTLTATSAPGAYAAARKALAATAAADSGTITGSVSHDGSSYTLDTTQWNGDAIEVTGGERSGLAPNRTIALVDGGAYVEQADGTWLHYASAAGVGPKVGPMVELARNNVAGSTADQILSLATGLTESAQPDGTTLYTGTVPNTATDAGVPDEDDTILRMIATLSNGPDNAPGAPGGYHDGLQLQMTVGSDGLVEQVSLTYEQQGTGSPETDGSYTWTVTYSDLGSTPPIAPPAVSTPTPPVIWSAGPPCTAPCGG
jgi:hypothetical protein